MKRYMLNTLKLVFPPISNQVADWLWKDDEVREHVKRSKLYMLGQREEVKMANFIPPNSTSHIIKFDLKSHSNSITGITFDLAQFNYDEEVEVELGPHLIRITKENKEVLQWFTVDKLFHDYWLEHIKLIGLEDFRKFTQFDLYYVGISKKGDSFSRLFDTGHMARTKILSNETQKTPGARLTDELFIFLFDIATEYINVAGSDDDIEAFVEGMCNPKTANKINIIADAEKAFIRILDAKYNTEKYLSYPISRDGLFNERYDRYAYCIGECISFISHGKAIKGEWHPLLGGNNADVILIDGEKVSLHTV